MDPLWDGLTGSDQQTDPVPVRDTQEHGHQLILLSFFQGNFKARSWRLGPEEEHRIQSPQSGSWSHTAPGTICSGYEP